MLSVRLSACLSVDRDRKRERERERKKRRKKRGEKEGGTSMIKETDWDNRKNINRRDERTE